MIVELVAALTFGMAQAPAASEGGTVPSGATKAEADANPAPRLSAQRGLPAETAPSSSASSGGQQTKPPRSDPASTPALPSAAGASKPEVPPA